MENQTRFDLNAAIENWRQELAAQPNLAPNDRRELETHLHDAIAGFQQRGLNDEESFWLAFRRFGQPQQLGEEYKKVNPAKVWRERLFWMWLAMFLSYNVNSLARLLAFAAMPVNAQAVFFTQRQWLGITLAMISTLTPLILAILLAKGKLVSQFSRLTALLDNRRRLAWAALGCIAISSALRVVTSAIIASKMNLQFTQSLIQNVSPFVYSVVIALLLVWLMPPQGRKSPKHA